MAEEVGHRLFIELTSGSNLMLEAMSYLNSNKDAPKRQQELFRCFVSVGCVVDDFSVLRREPIEEIEGAISTIEKSQFSDRFLYRFRIHQDHGDGVMPGFTNRYTRLPKPDKRLFVTRMFLLGFWFFTRFNSQFERITPIAIEPPLDAMQSKGESARELDRPTVMQINQDAADLFGGLDICF
jgi:hypothetical protein